MKSIIVLTFLGLSLLGYSAEKADSLGLPGDNFDLYAALELFKKSNSPQEFEKAINSSDNEINNLDLNADGKVDYVKVIDKSKDDSHSLVMQVDVSKDETQDVGVIEIEKTKDGNAHLQVIGDEALYGKDYIIEPKDESAVTNNNSSSTPSQKTQQPDDDVYATPDNSSNNNSNNYNTSGNNYNNNYNNGYYDPGPSVMVNVWGWPSVQYMYGPSYSMWVSPWYWGYYPGWWQPWGPIYWGAYYRRVYHYHYPYYHRTNYYSCRVAHNYYYGRRSSSATVSHYNRTGVYQKQQMAYRQSTPADKRYNSMPANEQKEKVMNQRMAQEQGNIKNPPQSKNMNSGKQQMNNGGEPKQMANQSKQFNNEQPKQFNNEQPKQFNNQPKEEVTQSRQFSQPKQMESQPIERAPRQQQSMPVQRQEAPHQFSGGGGGGGMRSVGGGMHVSGGFGGGGRRGR